METFTVICRGAEGKGMFKVYVPAETPEQAVEEARQRGHTVQRVFSPTDGQIDLMGSLSEEEGARVCRRCGYSLAGLPRGEGVVLCPECGHINEVARPDVEPGAGRYLEWYGLALGLLGAVWITAAFVGIGLGAMALQQTRGARGRLAVAAGIVGIVIHSGYVLWRGRFGA
jgi:hypothetical protein